MTSGKVLPMDKQPIVGVEELCFSYPARRRSEKPQQALQQISFSVGEGEIFGLLGPNGGGKTTLFKVLSTILLPSGGRVRIAGNDLQTGAARIRRHLGVAFQSPSLDKKLTVVENLMHHGHLYGMRGKRLKRRISDMLTQSGLLDRAEDLVETLSGGMMRRVELAKTLLHNPELLLLDEPSTGLDPVARRDMWERLSGLRDAGGVTILLTTHLMEEAAACDRLALLHEGGIVALGTPGQMTAEIGGDVIEIQTNHPEPLADLIRKRFGCGATVIDGTVRIEREGGHQFLPQLAEAFPGQMESISIHRPTLEDVFIHKTGRTLD
jgi:ABC-2 type transport system ATP-binding protein